jgi:hypothetical protein
LLLVFVVILFIGSAFFIGLYTMVPGDNPEDWQREHLRLEADRNLWKAENQVWQQERAEHERHSAMYNRDRMTWERERDHMRTERAEFQTELVLQDRERQMWAAEREEHVREKRQWDIERWEWEREERLHPGRCPVTPAGAHWDVPTSSPQCHSYGKREYSARLWDIPYGWSWVDACNATPINIHGISIRSPDFCEDLGTWGGVIGHWIVDFEEFSCEPALVDFHDAVCFSFHDVNR